MKLRSPSGIESFVEAAIMSQSGFLDNAYDGVVCIDKSSRITFLNDTFLKIFGYGAKEELLGQPVEILMGEFHARLHSRFVEQSQAEGKDYVAKSLRRLKAKRADGTLITIEIHVSRLTMGGEVYFAAFLRDMTEIERQEEELHQALYYDPLTGLPNANSIARFLDNYFDDSDRVAVRMVVFALDRMHAINTTFGLKGGDTLLKTAAAAIGKIFPDCLMAGRIRGRHFVVITEDSHEMIQSNMALLSEYVSRAFAKTLDLPHSHLLSTVSGGSIELPALANSTEQALKAAELARETAVSRGPGSFAICRDEDLSRSHVKSALPFRISEALENQDFQVYIQPKQSLRHGLCVGGECLIRWIHPDGSATPPDDFIPAAEIAGLISDIGSYVFRTACREIRRLSDHHGALKFSVNTSPIELQDPAFADRIIATLNETGVAANQVELEITETAMTHFAENQLAALNRLRDHGLSISLDDFGTGASSLANLVRLPIDRVKLDRSFVANIENNESAYILVKHAVEIARDLGKEVTVEGVESFEVRELVRLLGADEIQGFYYAKPKTPSAFEDFLFAEGRQRADSSFV
ncbi:MAG: EAL domain-containing protein [Alphaproteobacteria bacterium]|nr:EAL domain-containing protein [Alphaproteobacteria bacterium]